MLILHVDKLPVAQRVCTQAEEFILELPHKKMLNVPSFIYINNVSQLSAQVKINVLVYGTTWKKYKYLLATFLHLK